MKHIEGITGFKKSKDVDKGAEGSRSSMHGDIDQKDGHASERHQTYDPADSIMWDIERESYVEESEPSRHLGTIVLNVPGDLLARGKDKEKRRDAFTEMPPLGSDVLLRNGADADATLTKTSENSLHPSQSVSHVAQPKVQETGNQRNATFSKYFLPENVITTESNIHNRQNLCRLPTQRMPQPGLERNASRSIYPSPPRIEASATSLRMLGNKLPLPNIRSLENNAMELVRCDVFHRDASLGPELWSSDGEFLPFEAENIVSGKFLQHGPEIELSDAPLFEQESHSLSDEWCRQNVDIEGERSGLALFNSDENRSADGAVMYEPKTDAFNSRIAPSDFLPRPDDCSVCVDFESPTRADFSQGRSLLYGWDHGNVRVSDAEAEVAKLLRQKHWLPHRL